MVHLAGNGLYGELDEWLPTYSPVALTDISLSHSKLSGTIPLDFLKVAKLDLSFNQLDGEYVPQSEIYTASFRPVASLSGLEHELIGSLNVLRGTCFHATPSQKTTRACGYMGVDHYI